MAMPAVPGNAGSGFALPRVPPRRLRDGPKYAAQSRVAHVGCRQRNREAAAKGKAAGASAGAVPPSQNTKNQVFSVAPNSVRKRSKPFSRRPYAMPGSRCFRCTTHFPGLWKSKSVQHRTDGQDGRVSANGVGPWWEFGGAVSNGNRFAEKPQGKDFRTVSGSWEHFGLSFESINVRAPESVN